MARRLSIGIPTRNRQQYAMATVRSIAAALPDAQIVVGDNSDDSSLGAALAGEVASGRVCYAHVGHPLSFADNFEAVVERCSGDYVCVLGDDDTVGPQLAEIVAWASAEGVDAVTMRQDGRVLHYFWPGATSPRWGERLSAALFLSDFSGSARAVSRSDSIDDAVDHLGSGPRRLPRLYLGLVSRDLISRVRGRFGHIFGSVSPDMYSGVLLALEARKHFEIDFPFLLPGACPKSNSITHVTRPTEELTAPNHLKHFATEFWDQRVPRFYAAETVWAQAFIDVSRGSGVRLTAGGFADLYARCILKAPGRRLEVAAAMCALSDAEPQARIAPLVARRLVALGFGRFASFGRAAVRWRPGGARYEYRDLADTGAALARLTQHLEERTLLLRLP